MSELFDFEVHTPYRPFFSGKVELITLILSDGEIGILARHSPFTAPVRSCILRIRDEGGTERPAFITDGILEVSDCKTVLMVDAAEWPQEIDRQRALAAQQSAQTSLDSAVIKFETDKAQARLRRAEYRLKACELQETAKKEQVAKNKE
jgi:F-type H+-transporting ATPase subunit epsilon